MVSGAFRVTKKTSSKIEIKANFLSRLDTDPCALCLDSIREATVMIVVVNKHKNGRKEMFKKSI